MRWERAATNPLEKKGEDERAARLQPGEWHWHKGGYRSSLQREEGVQGDNEGGLWVFARILMALCDKDRPEDDTLR